MRYWDVVNIEKLLEAAKAGQPIDPRLLEKVEAAVAREREILQARADRSRENLERAFYRWVD